MKILITGASGFIGARIAERLLESPEYTVICAGRNPPVLPNSSFEGPRAISLLGNLSDPDFARKATAGVDIVIHSAGKAGIAGNYEDFYRGNVLLTQVLLDAARANSIKRFINISSPSIYFEFKDLFDLHEDYLPARFSDPYARTKYEAERLVAAAHSPEFLTVSLRPRRVIGAGDRNVLPRLIQAQKNGKLIQVGSGKNIDDVTSVSNLVDAVILCFEAPASVMGETYNISNGKPVLFWEFTDQVLSKLGISTKRKKLPKLPVMLLAKVNELWKKLTRSPVESGLLPISVAVVSQSMTINIEKAKTKLGYRPKQSTEEGVQEFVDWWTKTTSAGPSQEVRAS